MDLRDGKMHVTENAHCELAYCGCKKRTFVQRRDVGFERWMCECDTSKTKRPGNHTDQYRQAVHCVKNTLLPGAQTLDRIIFNDALVRWSIAPIAFQKDENDENCANKHCRNPI